MADYRYEKPPSAAVIEARARRLARASESVAQTEWFIKEVSDKVRLSVRKRVKIATELVKSKVVKNISRPVTKIYVSGRQGRDAKGQFTARKRFTRIRDRSKPGEFPKADTTQLLRTIFGVVIEESPGIIDGIVGTPLAYGLILELELDRSFLVRTLEEERTNVMRILTGPIV